MKVLGIIGSPNKESGSTGKLVKAFMSVIKEKGVETEIVCFTDLKINYCVSARQCHAQGRCVFDDDAGPLQEKMLSCHGLVLASPLYCGQISAQMKTLLDRSSRFFHCHMLEGKYGASISVAGSSEAERATEYMNYYLNRCGAQTVGEVCGAGTDGKFKEEEAVFAQVDGVARELVQAMKEKRVYPEQKALILEHQERMKNLVVRRKEEFPWEYDLIKQKGWV